MRSKIIFTSIIVLAILLGTQCSGALKIPTVLDAQKSGTNIDTLKMGRKLYIGNCGSCHSLFVPENYTASEWAKNVARMKKRAKITDEQSKLILQYVTINCKIEN